MARFSGRFLTMAVALAVIAVAAQVAVAQRDQGGRGRGRGGPGGPDGFGGGFISMAQLASVEKVQDALKVSDEQKTKIKKINDERSEEFVKARQDGGDREAMQKAMQKVNESSAKKLNEVLD